MAKECCSKNVPPLSNTRPPGTAWVCPDCRQKWIWDEDEAEGGAWWTAMVSTSEQPYTIVRGMDA